MRTMQEPRPISEEVAAHLEELRQEAEARFAQGYLKGKQDQQAEDRYYMDRVAELSQLLATAEAEIRRLRDRV